MFDETLEDWLSREVLRLGTECIQRGRPDLFKDIMRVHAEVRREREGRNRQGLSPGRTADACH